jgi:DNA-binding IclR family transcriptional regulator
VTKAENHPEMGGIAAPVRDHSGTVIAACGVAIPAFRMDRALIERCAALVTHAADAISRDLGFQNEQHRGRRYGT